MINTWTATYDDGGNGLTLECDGVTLEDLGILDWHTFDDGGATLETVRLYEKSQGPAVSFEMFSYDEGDTFQFDVKEV